MAIDRTSNGAAVDLPVPCPCCKLTSGRQRQILHRLMAGYDEKQTAASLSMRRSTVHHHIGRIYKVFNVNSRGELLGRLLSMVTASFACSGRVPCLV